MMVAPVMDLHVLPQVEASTEAKLFATPLGPHVVAAPLQGALRQAAEIVVVLLTQTYMPHIMVSVVGVWRPHCALCPLLTPLGLHTEL